MDTGPTTSPPQEVKAEETSLNGFLGFHLKRGFNAIHANLALTLRDFNLRLVTYSALVIIVEKPGLRQAQLADALGIERTNAVAIVDELVTRKLITRDPAPTDRRAYALQATKQGEELCREVLDVDHRHEKALRKNIPAAEISRFLDTLQLIEANAQEQLKKRSGSN